MTRLHVPLAAPRAGELPVLSVPDAVRIGEMALAAGRAGSSVAVCFQDFPAPVLAMVWQYFIRVVGAEAVFHVRSQADLNKLPERLATARLVMVHVPRLHVPTIWLIQMATAGWEEGLRPAMMSRFVPGDLEDDPGATLVVRAVGPPADTSYRSADTNPLPLVADPLHRCLSEWELVTRWLEQVLVIGIVFRLENFEVLYDFLAVYHSLARHAVAARFFR